MARWDPRPLPGARADDDRVRLVEPDVDDPAETLAHAQAHVARLEAQMRDARPTDPRLVERQRRDLAHWRRVVDSVTLESHWGSGGGDRTLF